MKGTPATRTGARVPAKPRSAPHIDFPAMAGRSPALPLGRLDARLPSAITTRSGGGRSPTTAASTRGWCWRDSSPGLSWLTILRKRESFRAAFANFDIEAVARFGDRDVERLLTDAGIVRHRGKIEATIANAKAAAALDVPLAELVWSYAPTGRRRAPRDAGRAARGHARVDRPLQGAEAARLSLRRTDHRLRGDAGLRDRQRPPRRLLGPRGGRARATRSPLSRRGTPGRPGAERATAWVSARAAPACSSGTRR